MVLDATHDPGLKSWVEPANQPGCDFPIQNLPFGIFKRKGAKESPRGGVAIGDQILDLAALGIKTGPTLNGLAAMGRGHWKRLRRTLSQGLSVKKRSSRFARHLVPMKQAELFLPVAIGDYSDFYTGIYHAQNAGRLFRPDNPLLPNYKYVPIGYHGRASSIVPNGTAVRRPDGCRRKRDAHSNLRLQNVHEAGVRLRERQIEAGQHQDPDGGIERHEVLPAPEHVRIEDRFAGEFSARL